MKSRAWIPAAITIAAAGIYLYVRPAVELFEVPDGYTGPVVVFYGHPEGTTASWRWGSHVYRVPTTGVLLVGSPAPRTSHDAWFYVKRDGSRSALTIESGPRRDCPADEPCVRGLASVTEGDQRSGELHWVQASIGRVSQPETFGPPPGAIAARIAARLRGEPTSGTHDGGP